jgi:hypothetical protein
MSCSRTPKARPGLAASARVPCLRSAVGRGAFPGPASPTMDQGRRRHSRCRWREPGHSSQCRNQPLALWILVWVGLGGTALERHQRAIDGASHSRQRPDRSPCSYLGCRAFPGNLLWRHDLRRRRYTSFPWKPLYHTRRLRTSESQSKRPSLRRPPALGSMRWLRRSCTLPLTLDHARWRVRAETVCQIRPWPV